MVMSKSCNSCLLSCLTLPEEGQGRNSTMCHPPYQDEIRNFQSIIAIDPSKLSRSLLLDCQGMAYLPEPILSTPKQVSLKTSA